MGIPEGAIPAGELEYWASLGRMDQVADCIARKIDVNQRGWGDYTPLHGAAEHGHPEVVQLLLDHGAIVNPRMQDGSTPLDWALRNGHASVAALLEGAGGKTGNELLD